MTPTEKLSEVWIWYGEAYERIAVYETDENLYVGKLMNAKNYLQDREFRFDKGTTKEEAISFVRNEDAEYYRILTQEEL